MNLLKLKIFSFLLLSLFSTVFFIQSATAATALSNEPSTICKLTIGLEVPNGFDCDVFFFLEKGSNTGDINNALQLKLSTVGSYKGAVDIVCNEPYYVNYSFDKELTHEVLGIDEGEAYTATEDAASLIGRIVAKTDIIQQSSDAGEISPESSGEEIFKEFKRKLSFMIDNPDDYATYHLVCGHNSQGSKEAFLEASQLNTEDSWNNMSDFEKFSYSTLYTRPYIFLVSRESPNSLEEFLRNEDTEFEYLVNEVKNGEVIKEAIKDVWVWHWRNWEQNGILVNIFTDEKLDGGKVQEEQEEEYQKEIKEAQKDVTDGMGEDKGQIDETIADDGFDKKDAVPSIIKNSLFSLAILVFLIIAILIVRHKKKKNN